MANPTIGATTPRVQYTATGGQTLFTVPFEFIADADLAVYVGTTLQTLTTNYTVTGANTSGGGSITFTAGQTAGDVVTILGNQAYSRTTNKYTKFGLLPAETLEGDFDATTVQLKQLARDGQFAIRAPQTDSGTPAMTLPAKATRASKVLGFDASGNPVQSTNTLSNIDLAVTTVNTIAAAPGNLASNVSFVPSGTLSAVTVQNAITELMTDASASTGSSLIGYLPDGTGAAATTVQAALRDSVTSLHLRKPRKLFSKLFAAASATTRLKWVQLGDSLAYRKTSHIISGLDRRFGAVNNVGVNTSGSTVYPQGGNDLDLSTTVSATTETAQYQYWVTGTVLRIDSGGSALWVRGGVSPTFTTVKVYYIKEAGAGTINLVVGGSTVATDSAANASVALGTLSYTQASGQSSVSVTATGASVRVLFVHYSNSTLYGVDLYANTFLGGLSLSNAMSSAQGRGIFDAVLTDIAPDVLSFEMDDNFGDGSTNDAALTLLTSSLDSVTPLADKIFIGSTPRSSDDAGKITSAAKLKLMCSGKNASYLYFDSYYLMGSYADMTSIFGADDGVHPTAAAEAYAGEILWDQLGLNNFNLGYVHRAINDASTTSNISKNSAFVNGNSIDRGTDLKIETDNNGYDWDVTYGRSLKFSTRGAYGAINGIVARFSGNVAVFPHIIPFTACNFTSGTTGPGTSTSTSTGRNVLSFVDTSQTDGGLPIGAQMFIPRKYTVATLPNANSYIGGLAAVSDATVTTPNTAPVGGGTNYVLLKSAGVSGSASWLIV